MTTTPRGRRRKGLCIGSDSPTIDAWGPGPATAPWADDLPRDLRKEFDDTVLDRLHGLPSGENRDGRIRADVLEQMWGSEVYGVMRAIEDALDPRGILNPGVTLSSSESWESWDVLAARETL